LVRRAAGIEKPADLKGKRVGVPEYQQTAALWGRGVLQHEFGVTPQDMEFWMERTPEMSHGGATGFAPPPGVTVNQIPAEKSIGSMMLHGELDAVLHYLSGRNLVDRSRADLTNNPNFKYLFPDPIAEGIRYYKKTGLLPINHQTVVRRDVFDKEPWVALNLIKAFNRANEIADAQRVAHVQDHLAAGLLSGDAKTTLLHHGVKANRKVMETIAQYSLEQGLTPRLIAVEELYAPSAMDT
jgi:4,5-dihydroxyphthalate decarboxylase